MRLFEQAAAQEPMRPFFLYRSSKLWGDFRVFDNSISKSICLSFILKCRKDHLENSVWFDYVN